MRNYSVLLYWFLFVSTSHSCTEKRIYTTVDNPLNLNYPFDIKDPLNCKAADRVIILFKDKYYLFASKAGGYCISDNFKDWKLIGTSGLPRKDYVPAVNAIDETVYFIAKSHSIGKGVHSIQKIFKTIDSSIGEWEIADPAFFRDEDGKLYLHFGLGRNGHIKGVELGIKNNFNPKGEVFTGWMLLSYSNPFEVSSALEGNPGNHAFDENIKTYWSAESGNTGGFVQLDLEGSMEIKAIKINYAEHDTEIYGRDTTDYHQYLLQISDNGKDWSVLKDKRNSEK